MCIKMHLIWMQKKMEKSFRTDPREDSKVKGPMAKFIVTRSYDHDYKCITCTGDSKHSIF